jgi:dihydrofolate reductase
MKISIIVSMDGKRGIGKENALMWHIPGELPRFKQITMGHPIIMGRKTFESIGRPLLGRTNIVITQNPDFKAQDCKIVGSVDEAIEIAKKETGSEEIFIIGGGQIYQQAISKADRLYLTLVNGDFGAVTFFPDYSSFTKVIEEEDREEGDYNYKFLTLEK